MPLPRRRSSWIDPSSSSPSARKHPRRRRRSRGTWFVPPRRPRPRRAAAPKASGALPETSLSASSSASSFPTSSTPARRSDAARPSCSRPPRRPRARGETPILTRGRGASPNVTTAFRVRAPASPRATTPPLVARDDAAASRRRPSPCILPASSPPRAAEWLDGTRRAHQSGLGAPFSGQNAQYRDVSLPRAALPTSCEK